MELGSSVFWKKMAEDPKRLAQEICLIDVSNLDKTLRQHASLRAWINAADESARIEVEQAKFETTKAYARAIIHSKEGKGTSEKRGKPVELMKAEAELDAKYQSAMDDFFEAQQKRIGLRAMSTALEDRLQMLMQISANQRKERHDTAVTSS